MKKQSKIVKTLANFAAMHYTRGINPMPRLRNFGYKYGFVILHWTEIAYIGKNRPSNGIVVHPRFEDDRVRVLMAMYDSDDLTVVSSESMLYS